MPEKLYIVCGASAGFLVVAFFLSGFHHEIKWRIRERRRGGMIL